MWRFSQLLLLPVIEVSSEAISLQIQKFSLSISEYFSGIGYSCYSNPIYVNVNI